MMEDLSLHILDIAENAVTAGATRVTVLINENERRDLLTIRVRDNGPGMPPATRRRALDPFFSTKGKATGLGLPLLAQAAEQSGGKIAIRTAPGRGTRILASFRFSHIDRPPLTRMTGTLSTLILGHGEVDFFYRHRRGKKVYRLDTRRWRARTDAAAALDPVLSAAIRTDLERGLRRLGRT